MKAFISTAASAALRAAGAHTDDRNLMPLMHSTGLQHCVGKYKHSFNCSNLPAPNVTHTLWDIFPLYQLLPQLM